MRLIGCAVTVTFILAFAQTVRADSSYVRLNQAGYLSTGVKRAVLLASGPVSGNFSVVDGSQSAVFTAPVPSASLGSWSLAFLQTYALDFSAVTTPGAYHIAVDGVVSPTFQIGSGGAVYGPLVDHSLFYFEAQRDGADVDPSILSRKPAHLADEAAFAYLPPVYQYDQIIHPLKAVGGPIDASGGWFDAGDFLKFVETCSYVTGVMLFTVRECPMTMESPGPDFLTESRVGLDWLLKMWDQDHETLYYQLGIGDGAQDGSFGGDHYFWRLPEEDDQRVTFPGDYWFYIKFRPLLRAGRAHSLISPNLAGRLAAAFGLGSQVYRATDPAYANRCLQAAETVLGLADIRGISVTTSPDDYYPETEWRDDLEWGAAEIALALQATSVPKALTKRSAASYIRSGSLWASRYIRTHRRGPQDTLNLYDNSALAHYDLARAMGAAGKVSGLLVNTASLTDNMKKQLQSGADHAATDPFRFGLAYGSGQDLAPHAFGLAVTAQLYAQLTGSTEFDAFAAAQCDWALGCNGWGASFVIGAGTSFPFEPQNPVANLVGSLDGTGQILLGGVVDGPQPASVLAGLGLLDCMLSNPQNVGNYTAFTATFGNVAVGYLDWVASWPTVEPADDYTVIALLAFAQRAAQP